MKTFTLIATGLASIFLLAGCDFSSQPEQVKDTPQDKMKARFVASAEKFQKAGMRLTKISDGLYNTIFTEQDEDTYYFGIDGRRKALIDISATVVKDYTAMIAPPIKPCEDIKELRRNLPVAIDEKQIPALLNPQVLQDAFKTKNELGQLRDEIIPILYRSNADLTLVEAKLKNFENKIAPFVKSLSSPPTEGKIVSLSPIEEQISPERERLKAVFGPLNEWQNSFIASLPQCENIMVTWKSARIAQKRVP